MNDILPLTSDEVDLIRRSLAAAADGPFFDDDEFDTLFGISRAELRQACAEWSAMEAPVESLSQLQWLAAAGAAGQLWGYPHGKPDALREWLGVPVESLGALVERINAVGSRPIA